MGHLAAILALLGLQLAAPCAISPAELNFPGTPQELYERRGCCSHHKGVCGCRSGRAVCCDGSLSPSCGC